MNIVFPEVAACSWDPMDTSGGRCGDQWGPGSPFEALPALNSTERGLTPTGKSLEQTAIRVTGEHSGDEVGKALRTQLSFIQMNLSLPSALHHISNTTREMAAKCSAGCYPRVSALDSGVTLFLSTTDQKCQPCHQL